MTTIRQIRFIVRTTQPGAYVVPESARREKGVLNYQAGQTGSSPVSEASLLGSACDRNIPALAPNAASSCGLQAAGARLPRPSSKK